MVKENGGAEAPPAASVERRHLCLGRLPADGVGRVVDRTLERLPGLADDSFVGGDGALGGHAKRVRLHAHVGGEFTLALCLAIEADRTIEVLIAAVVGELGGRISRFSDCAGVELASTVRGADVSADDPLKVNLHCAFTQAVPERVGGFDDEPLMQIADAVAVLDRKAEAFGDVLRMCRVGSGEPDHFESGALAKRDDTGAGASGTSRFGHGEFLIWFRRRFDPAPAGPPFGCGRRAPPG